MIEVATQNAPAEYINALPKKQFSFFEKEHSAFELDRVDLTTLPDGEIFAAHHCTVSWRIPS
jgi:hypothetical protein